MMGLGRIRNGNSLFRHCIYPISFNKKTSSFAYEKMWYLQIQSDGAFHGSLAWERYVPTAEYVHGYGCRLASGINTRKKEAGKFKEKDRHFYCGAYQVRGQAVRALASIAGLDEIASTNVVHQVEAGEIAHADLRIFLKPGIDVEGTKTAIVDRLWNASSGPLRHRCESDLNTLAHHNSDLTEAPAGQYHFRLWIIRVFWILRFRILNWLWLRSTRSQVWSWIWRRVYQD
jgi:hypothetical protein